LYFQIDPAPRLLLNRWTTDQGFSQLARTNKKRLPEGPFYRDLGRNVRTARSAAGKSQSEVAEFLNVTFQQVQKYENGKNRIPLDRLVSLAAFLEVPLQQFIDPSESDSEFQSLASQFRDKEFHTLMEAWGVLKDRPMRAALLNLVKRMADLKC
jgi:transcriptional regulator with XRE-family HTH domain